MAAALEAFLGGTAVPGTAAAAAVAGVATASAITSATARANPNAIPYAPDAYASGSPPKEPPPFQPIDTDDEDRGTPMGVWAAGIAALAILAIAGFLVFRLLSGPGGTIGPSPSQVAVPNFVGLTFLEAQALANQSGLTVAPTASPAPSGVAPNTVIAQDPPAGGSIAPGGTVKLTVAAGPETVAVPDLRNKTETDAFNLLAAAGLQIGTKTEAFDPVVPAGQVVTQNPPAGVVVNKGTPIDYTLSQGPQPSASPSPSPTSTPTPTPTPTPAPTPTPPPALVTVADYRCITLAQATAALQGDGFALGTVTAQPAGYTAADDSIVIQQSPSPGQKRAPGTPIDLTVYDPASLGSCPP
jgi:beta-lactam-binding protein with PASTA domain